MLEVQNLQVRYGRAEALHGVSFCVEKGGICAILGANGAGKSTILRTLAGIVPPCAGSIRFDGAEIAGSPPPHIVRRGITLCPEGRRIFPQCTVLENLQMGAYTVRSSSLIQQNLDTVFAYFPRLRERIRQTGATLSGGEQQMLGVARALMSSPRLLLLDVPSLGLVPLAVEQIFAIIRQINQADVTILLVEQNAFEALQISSAAHILEAGKIILSGPSKDLLQDPRVVEAYLGI